MKMILNCIDGILSGIHNGYELMFDMMDENGIDQTATRIAVIGGLTILMPFIVVLGIIAAAVDEIALKIHQYF